MSLGSLIIQYLPPYAVCKDLTNQAFKSLQTLPPTSGLNLSITLHNEIDLNKLNLENVFAYIINSIYN